MSGIYNQHLENEEREAFSGYLSKLVELDDLTDPTLVGITKKVIADGVDSLSAKQKYRFDKDVMGQFPQPKCERCRELIPFNEAYEYIHERSLCGSCQHTWDKMERE